MLKFLTIVTIATLISGCAAVGSHPQLDRFENVQRELITIARYEDKVAVLLAGARTSSGANTVIFAVYDEDYQSRVIFMYDGERPSDDSLGRISTEVPGHDYIYGEMRDGQTISLDVDELDVGPLRSVLQKAGVKHTAVSPVFGEDGYLIGYVALNWNTPTDPDIARGIVEITAEQITQLSPLL
jgi:hypothetical protein